MKSYLCKLFSAFGLALLASGAQAASLVDFSATGMTTAATNITDTASAAAAFVLPIIIGVVALLVGIRLFKRFTQSI